MPHSSTPVPREHDLNSSIPSWLGERRKGTSGTLKSRRQDGLADAPVWPPNPATRWRQSSWKHLPGLALWVSGRGRLSSLRHKEGIFRAGKGVQAFGCL